MPSTLSDRIQAAFDLSGRTAVVTGANGGLGRESAFLLAEAGARIVAMDLDQADVDELAGELTHAGHQASGTALDVTDETAVSAAFEAALAETGRIDVLVNSAGIVGPNNPLADVPIADLDQILDVNVKGTFLCCQAVVPHMVERGSGSIVNASSGAIDYPSPGRSPYAITKAAVAQLTRNLATEISPDGVRVNALAPGFFPSRMTSRRWTAEDGTVDKAEEEKVRREFARQQAMPVLGDPVDQAFQVLYLASDAARFVTGQIFRANGGLAMPW